LEQWQKMGSGSHFQAAKKVKPTPLLLNRQGAKENKSFTAKAAKAVKENQR
jgi:hypothetical protein